MHHIAVVPQTVPFVLLDGLTIEIDVLRQTAFYGTDRVFGQRPDAKRPLLMKIFWGREQTGVGRETAGRGRDVGLPAVTVFRHDPQYIRPGYAVGGAHTLLHILVTGNQIVCHRVIMTEIHGLGLRTPKPHGHFCLGTAGLGYLYGGWVGLPEVFQADADTTADIADKGIAGRPETGKGAYPGRCCRGTFAHREGVVGQLGETETVPLGPMVEQHLVLRVKLIVGRNTLPKHLLLLEVTPDASVADAEVAPTVERLYGFCPHATIVRSKGNMTVIEFFSHRHTEPDT